ncbi:MAG: hypothetical protein GF405_00140 [Candidatus Eisenbacteria bacterium]|nr:hypothetical protein [Candidatus Eisenbacteria bacterium]
MATRTVEIPEETYSALEQELERLGFASVDELVSHALGLLVSGRADESDDTERELSEAEKAEMKERLADLGYM